MRDLRQVWAVFSRMRAHLVLAMAMAISALVLVNPIAAQDFQFNSFDVQGNQRVETASILTFAGIPAGETVSGGVVNDALQRLQNTGLFESVEVIPRGNTLAIIVQEYPTINQISIEGNDRLDDENLQSILASQPRRVYSPSVAEQDAEAITAAYRQSGRLTATVTPQIIRRSDNRVDLVFEVTEGRVIETERISFVGNRSYSDRRLRRVLESTQAGFFRAIISRDTFVADRVAFDQQLLTDFYRDRGYVDFEVQSVVPELTRSRDAYFITFNIVEGQSFTFGEVNAVSDLPDVDVEAYQEAIRLRPGTTYSPRLVDATISRLENLATQQGLRFIRVEPRVTRNDEALSLDVDFEITRGDRVFVERIDIEGNATTLDRVIRAQFDTVEGDPFDPRAIRQAAERIRALGFFSDASVEGREGTSPDQVIVDVDVEEQPTGSLGFAVSFSSDTGAGVGIEFSETNFLGRGQRLEAAIDTASESQSISMNFIEPAFLRRDLAFGLSIYANETSQQNAAYNTRNVGIRPSLGFPVSELGRMNVFYRISEDSITNVTTASSPILQREAGERITSSLGLTYSYDSRGEGLNPEAGVFFSISNELAGLGGDAEYLRSTATAIAETSILREEVNLRAAFEAGGVNMINGNSRIPDRFFLSSRQMRGFEPGGVGPRDNGAANRDALGGNFYAAARFEAAFPLGLPEEYGLSGGVFYDIGTVWGLDDVAGAALVDDGLHWRSSVGFSIFWDTQIGPLRFNFSRALDTQTYDRTRDFDLTIEARF
mgnify:CR=1 FL=1